MMFARATGLWVLCGLLGARPACAAAPAWDMRTELADTAWIWADPQDLDLPGSRLRWQSFSTAAEPALVARRLLRLRGARLERLQFANGTIWLSGLSGTVHWLVQLDAHGGRTVGSISSLDPRDAASPGFDARAYAPASARRVLHLVPAGPGQATLTRLEAEGSETALRSETARRLRAAGWVPVAAAMPAVGAPPAEWRHPGGARLFVLHEIRRGRVVFTYWHYAAGDS